MSYPGTPPKQCEEPDPFGDLCKESLVKLPPGPNPDVCLKMQFYKFITDRPTTEENILKHRSEVGIPESYLTCRSNYVNLTTCFPYWVEYFLTGKTQLTSKLESFEKLKKEYKLDVLRKKLYMTQLTESALEFSPEVIKVILPSGKFLFRCCFSLPSIRDDDDCFYEYIAFPEDSKEEVEKFLKLMEKMREEILRSKKEVYVTGGHNIQLTGRHSFDNLILTDKIQRDVLDDLECWMKMEKEYKSKGIPYRRGYLFEGPPGNGKTALLRAIMYNHNFNMFSFDFSNPDISDGVLVSAFSQAARSAPSLIIMEDIDRLFVPDSGPRARITKSGFLNCLDGVAIYSGLVLIATANHPESLDPAIRHRPGRFDMPVYFPNPEKEQRTAFLKKLLGEDRDHAVGMDVVEEVSEGCAGMSMAFLKLVYEKAAMLSIRERQKIFICEGDLKEALLSVTEYYTKTKDRADRTTGFI